MNDNDYRKIRSELLKYFSLKFMRRDCEFPILSNGDSGYSISYATSGTSGTYGFSGLILQPVTEDTDYPGFSLDIDAPGITETDRFARIRLRDGDGTVGFAIAYVPDTSDIVWMTLLGGGNLHIRNSTGGVIAAFEQGGDVVIGGGVAGKDYSLTFDGETNDGVITWMEDEDYFKFSDDVMFADGENIVLDTTTGTMIGTSASQKIGLWGATPVVQAAHIADAAGLWADNIAKFNAILVALENAGITAKS